MMKGVLQLANSQLHFRYGRSGFLDYTDMLHLGDGIYDLNLVEPQGHIHQLKYDSRLSIVTRIHRELGFAGICTICGNGATSLAKKLTIFLRHEKLLKIAMVTVPLDPNLEGIRRDIYKQIQHAEIDDCILVLDGFWWVLSNDDFKALGIPSPRKSFFIVFASRNEDICAKIGRGYVYHINFLEDEEALDLFKEKAGNSALHLGLQETARKIVEECDGFRFSILTIASALKDNPADIWEASLTRLQNLNEKNISDKEKVLSIIQISYDLLEEKETRLLFCLCCLFPEDFNIPVEDLVLFGKGMQLFDNVHSMHQARDRVECIIQKLKDSFCILDGFEDDTVKVHNMYRDFGLSIFSKWEHPYVVECVNRAEVWPLTGAWSQNWKAFSFMCRTIKKHPSYWKCQNLDLLQLSFGKDSAQLPEGIFKELQNLKVVSLSTYSLPRSLILLNKLRTLCINESISHNMNNKSRPRIRDLLGAEMKFLEHFSFSTERSYCDFPAEIGLLHNLRYLKFNAGRLKYIPAGVLSKLAKLEELYLPQDFISWGCKQEGGERMNARLSEIESLHLTALRIGVSKGSVLADKLVKNLKRFCVFVGSHVSPDHEFGTTGNSKISLEVFDVDAGDFEVSWISDLVWKAETLRLKQVRHLKSLITWQPNKNIEFPQWKKICIIDCKEMEYLVGGQISWSSFSHLKSLKLFGLYNLEQIRHGLYLPKIEGPCFVNLCEIQILFCRKLKYVFSVSVATELRQLQSLQICFCDELEAVFHRDANQAAVNIGKEDVAMDAIVFPRLKTMELAYMDKLRIFYDGKQSFLLPALESFSVFQCNHLEAFCYGVFETPLIVQAQFNGYQYSFKTYMNAVLKKSKWCGGAKFQFAEAA